MNKGDICVLELPRISGKEQFGARPAIILSDTKTGLIIIIPLTSNLETLKFPFTIRIHSSSVNGLEKDSIALAFQMRAVDKRRLKRKIGILEREYLTEIDGVIRSLFKL